MQAVKIAIPVYLLGLTFICSKKKTTQRHVENVIMMFNHADFSDNAYVYLRMRLLAQTAILTMRYFYGST